MHADLLTYNSGLISDYSLFLNSKMSKPRRKPLFNILLFTFVACAIYFVASSDRKSLPTLISTRANSAPVVDPAKAAIAKQNPIDTKLDAEIDLTGAQDLEGSLTETPFMPKMANETLKAQLGNSAWHLLHTVLARFPEEPSASEKSTLKQFVHLFAQVYPCGDCARHFQKLLKKYPPQVGSRKTAAVWGCHIHNKVNERLNKDEYDCTKILEDYDCGCGDDEKKTDFTLGNESMEHLRQISVDEVSPRQGG